MPPDGSMRLAVGKHWLQNFFQRTAPPKDSGLHGTDVALENFSHLLVAEAFEVAQNHGSAKDLGKPLQGAADSHLNFLSCKHLERRGAEILNFQMCVAFLRPDVDRNVLLQMALEPALVVQRFSNGDAVEPSFQRAALAEVANAAEGLKKNFLGAIGGIGSVAKHAEDEVIDRRMVIGDEPVESRLRAGLQLLDEIRLI